MFSKRIFTILVCLTWGSFAYARPSIAPSSEALLRKVLSVQDHIPFSARQTVIVTSGVEAHATVTQELHTDLTHTRITYLMPKSAEGRTIVMDGRVRWEHDPQNHIVIQSPMYRKPLPTAQIGLLVDRLKRIYRVTVDQKPVVISGRPTYVMRLNPIYKDRHSRVWYVDRSTHFIVKREVYDVDGSLDSSSTYNNLDYHLTVKPSDISFHMPRNTRLVQRADPQRFTSLTAARNAAPTWARIPNSIGKGYEFIEARLIHVKGIPSLHLSYSDGLVELSLIEIPGKNTIMDDTGSTRQVNVNGANGRLYQRASVRALSWFRSGKTLTLIADLADSTMLNLAKSLP